MPHSRSCSLLSPTAILSVLFQVIKPLFLGGRKNYGLEDTFLSFPCNKDYIPADEKGV